jgi:hypothetical protein
MEITDCMSVTPPSMRETEVNWQGANDDIYILEPQLWKADVK